MDARSHSQMDITPLSAQRPVPEAVRRSLRSERGFGLVELLVVIPMMAVVLLGIYALYNVGAKGQRQNTNRVTSLLRQQNGLERMTREMRQAISFKPVSSQILDAETYVRPSDGSASVEKHVRYECVNSACTRYEGAANGSTFTQSETVISNVENADVFFFQPNSITPTFTAVKLEVKVSGANNPMTLDGGFALRNQGS
jgi:type II secretory pathway pseudopilin PulG